MNRNDYNKKRKYLSYKLIEAREKAGLSQKLEKTVKLTTSRRFKLTT